MSRSYRKPFIKDKPKHGVKRTSTYWRTIRRVWKHHIHIHLIDEPEIPHNKNIINDYDYCDYSSWVPEISKYSRK